MALHVRRRSRTTSARRTLVSLVLIPLLSLAALWGFTASITLGDAISNQHLNTLTNVVAPRTVAMEAAGQAERALTVAWVDSGDHSSQQRAQLLAARRAYDTAIAAWRGAAVPTRGLMPTTGQARLDDLLIVMAGLPRIRGAVDAGTDSPVTAFTAYTTLSSAQISLLHEAAVPPDPTLNLMTQAAIAFERALDFSGGAVALIQGALAANGQMTQAERTLFAQVVAEQDLASGDTLSLATPQLAAVFRLAFDSPAYRQLQAAENRIIATPAGQHLPVSATAFQGIAQAVRANVGSAQLALGPVMGAKSAQLSDDVRTELYLAAGLGLLAVIASIFVAVRFGRRLRRELTSLYDSARQMAGERLPRLVDRLRRGDDVDAEAESPPLPTGRITEIADVARAFTAVQRTAVEAAVGQAALRKGVNQVFVSLSLRNQSLLHRQLGLLDDMERATSDPVALADLFLLDHLTTRMRRHAEGLLILAGSTPGRGWRDPVPVADVLNAAVAEVEDYVRVEVVTESTETVAGIAVNDVIHLLAELVENATVYSPPNTRVEVRGASVGHGFAIEVEDRGLGMPADEIAALNERLAQPPEFDLASTDQLGLFVAARLAQRHGIKISLRQSPYGGTSAIVLLPASVTGSGDDPGWSPGTATALAAGLAPWPATGGLVNGTRAPVRESLAAEADGSAPPFGLTGRHRRLGSEPAPGPVAGPAPVPGPRFAPPPSPVPQRATPGPSPARPALPAADPVLRDTPEPPWGQPEAHRPVEAPVPSTWFSPGRAGRDIASGGATLPRAKPGNAVVDGNRPGLPRRARGTSLAPQLRTKLNSASAPAQEGSLSPAWAGSPAAAEPSARSPEEAGSLLSALQDGWERGRIQDLDDFDGEDHR
jgi:signal transduction histidine kinase